MKPEEQELPRWATRFLKAICPPERYEEIEGDLIQKFAHDVQHVGEKRAKRIRTKNVLRYFRLSLILRNQLTFERAAWYMIGNYFKMSFRHMLRSKTFTLINVSGLAVGITAFLLILQYVSFEMSYDQFHPNAKQIYRIGNLQYENGEVKNTSAKNYSGFHEVLKDEFPEIGSFTAFAKIPANTGILFSYEGQIYNELGGQLNADSNFFKVFPGLLIRGNPETVLTRPDHLVLSATMARKVFGDDDPIGKTLGRLDENDAPGSIYTVAGVFADFPAASHMQANFISYAGSDWVEPESYWTVPILYTYITLDHPDQVPAIERRLNHIITKKAAQHPTMKGTTVFLQALTDIHLRSNLKDELQPGGNLVLLIVLAAIGAVVLVMAWINYVNIETARFMNSTREAGIRYLIGSRRRDLALQFLIRYACLNMIAITVAIALVGLALPHFSYLTGIPVSGMHWATPVVWITGAAVFIVGSTLAGIYPAVFMMRMRPLQALRGSAGKAGSGTLRKSMTVAQFTASMVLIAFLLIVQEQLSFMQHTNKKIDIGQTIVIRNPTSYANQTYDDKFAEFKKLENTLRERAGVKWVSASSAIPGTEIGFTFVDLIKRNRNDPYDPTRYKTLFIDYQYIPLYGLRLKAGRNFSSENQEDEKTWHTILLNESAVRQLGFKSPEEAVGTEVHFHIWEEWERFKVVGVVEDYHHEAVKKSIFPMIFYLNHNMGQQVYYSIKVSEHTNSQDVLTYVERTWKDIFPDKPLDYFFLDDYYDQQFKSERHFSRIFTVFAGVAIFIACLGIFGMTLFEANARVREVGIRKVLGASAASLVALLTRDHVRIALLSILLALPMIYFSAREWLEMYPSSIAVSGIFFVVPGGIMLLLVIITSSFQTIRTAIGNPVKQMAGNQV